MKIESKFDKISNGVIFPIMQKIHEVAFESIETFKGDTENSIFVPLSVKEGLLEELDQIIEHCKSKASYYNSASIIGFAIGKDGLKPVREYNSMAEVATALRDLIAAKDKQIKTELQEKHRQGENERIASVMGF